MTGLTRAPAGGAGKLHPEGSTGSQTRLRATSFLQRSKLYLVLIGLMLPTLIGLALFTYYPQFGAIKYSLYNWDGGTTEEFIGFGNFKEAFTVDPRFWQSFYLVLILLGANIVKMWPSIFAAICLHRIRSERWQYIYRVLFVVPMIIPGIVGLLVWKSFFEANSGALNAFLNATGLMGVLDWLDESMAGNETTGWVGLVNTGIARAVRDEFVIGSVHGLWWMIIVGVLLIVLRMVSGSIFKLRSNPVAPFLTWGAVLLITTSVTLALLLCSWPTQPLGVFADGNPAWLGNQNLIIPSVIFWGFPWVGTVGVLIYLAGLQNITQDVYEAAELDGVGSIRKLFAIELPLIMTQVRINLIFLTIGTISDYGFFLLLLGNDGGPGGKGMVPGLYMYRAAFIEQRFGYACALGMVLFVILLAITVFYQKYVKVDK
jgi:ABC-type sugar transport system permease subunit